MDPLRDADADSDHDRHCDPDRDPARDQAPARDSDHDFAITSKRNRITATTLSLLRQKTA